MNHVPFYMEEPEHDIKVHKFQVKKTETQKHKIEVEQYDIDRYQTEQPHSRPTIEQKMADTHKRLSIAEQRAEKINKEIQDRNF